MTRSRLVLPLYAVAESSSYLANSAIQLTLPWLVLLRTGDPAAAALVAAVVGVVQIGSTVAAGPLIDRFGARRTAVIADLGSAVSVAALAVLDRAGSLTLAAMVVWAAAGALFDVPGMTARQTMMRRIAERSGASLDSVAGLRQALIGMAFLVGPAAVGVLLGVLPPASVLAITAGCSVLAAAATLGLRVAPVGADDADPGVRGAWRTVRRVPVLVRLFAVSAASSLISAPLVSVLLPTYFAAVDRSDLLGYTLSSLAVGIVAGSVAFSVLARRSRRLAWTAALITIPAGLAGVATLAGFWAVAAGALLLGIGVGILNPIYGVVVSERVPESQLGRVMALSTVVSLLAGPIGLAAASVVVTIGALPVLAWAIAGVAAAAAVAGLCSSRLRDLDPVPGRADHRPAAAADAQH